MPRGVYKRIKLFGFQKGHKKFGFGKGSKHTKETREKMVKVSVKERKSRKRFVNQRYNARKREADGSHIFGEWELLKKQYGYTCPCCGRKEPDIQLTEDHIVPLSRGGSDYIENIQPLCNDCNRRKYTKIIRYS